jgi:uncharacterized membrane protein
MELLIAAAAIVMALIALSKGSGYDVKLAQLKLRIGQLEDELAALRKTGVVSPVVTPPLEPEQAVEPPAEGPAPISQAEPEAAALAAAPEPTAAAAKVTGPDMEQRLATRWFVWLGGAAIAIGGLLFVKYAYDVGLISPALQIILGLIIGAGLVGAGEFIRKGMGEAAEKSFVPAALSAAGIAVAFGSILAAYTLYNLVGPTPAFIGLAAVALAALALSLRQGPLIAALGVAGSYLTPMLISSPDPSAATFFPYIAIVQAACFAILRRRPWHWLGYVGILGSLVWVMLWVMGPFEAADTLPIGLFAYVSAAIALFGLEGLGILKAESGSLLAPQQMSLPLRIAVAGLAAAAIMLVALVFVSNHQTVAVALFLLGMVAIAAISWFKEEQTIAAPIAGAAALIVLAGWEQASFMTLAMDEQGYWSNVLGGDAWQYLRWMLAAGAIFTAFGAMGVLRRNFTLPWAMLAAGASFLSLFLAWARVDQLLSQPVWAALAIIALAVLAALAWMKEGKLDDISSGLLVAASAALAVFAADRLLDGIWLTIAIAGLSAAFAWWGINLAASWLGPVATALGAIAAIRLFLARELWGEDKTLPLGAHWPLYGYGFPVLLLWQGARFLRRAGREPFAVALEGASLGLAIALVSLELRVLIGGNITVEDPSFLEMAAHIMAWLGAAYGLLYRQRLFSSFVSLWGARVLLAVSIVAIVFFSCGVFNPVFTGEPLQGNLVFNALLLAFLAPAILIALIALRSETLGSANLRMPLGLASLALAMIYVTLQTKRIFQGRLMELPSYSNGEFYAYSVVWLVCALLLFLAGIRLGRQYIRYAGLGVMALVVCKVFLWDMSGLEGLWRIASFVGLGLCLVGIGWLYQKFVQAAAKG